MSCPPWWRNDFSPSAFCILLSVDVNSNSDGMMTILPSRKPLSLLWQLLLPVGYLKRLPLMYHLSTSLSIFLEPISWDWNLESNNNRVTVVFEEWMWHRITDHCWMVGLGLGYVECGKSGICVISVSDSVDVLLIACVLYSHSYVGATTSEYDVNDARYLYILL